ncbi:hypothetical protein AAC387_Pa02g3011 [Persea americana]
MIEELKRYAMMQGYCKKARNDSSEAPTRPATGATAAVPLCIAGAAAGEELSSTAMPTTALAEAAATRIAQVIFLMSMAENGENLKENDHQNPAYVLSLNETRSPPFLLAGLRSK